MDGRASGPGGCLALSLVITILSPLTSYALYHSGKAGFVLQGRRVLFPPRIF
jgi:hypothetical protein